MAYDELLAARIRDLVFAEPGLSERRMFGGQAFLINGHLTVAGSSRGLLLRVEPADTLSLCEPPHVRPMVMRGREMDGWLHVDPEAVASDAELERWVRHGVTYARSLPPK